MVVVGLDTSNYTTSLAVFDGKAGNNASRLLKVRPGELGLRQSEALFQHIQQLPELFRELEQAGHLHDIAAVGASTRPRAVEGSYMPCFLAGTSQGKGLSSTLGVPFFEHSHQQGHLAVAAWSADRLDMLDQPFLAWHLSGGTTELLYVEPDGVRVKADCVGGSSDISAGQLIDRTGVLLGLQFPAGKYLDELSKQSDRDLHYKVKLNDLRFSLSGIENKVQKLMSDGEKPEDIARFTLNTITDVVIRATQQAKARWPGLPVLCSGGVASNSHLRQTMEQICQGIFAQPKYSTDNAMGTAILTWRALQSGESMG